MENLKAAEMKLAVVAAIFVSVAISLAHAEGESSDHWETVSVHCPAQNGGLLEILQSNAAGDREVTKIWYDESGNFKVGALSVGFPEGELEEWARVDLETITVNGETTSLTDFGNKMIVALKERGVQTLATHCQ